VAASLAELALSMRIANERSRLDRLKREIEAAATDRRAPASSPTGTRGGRIVLDRLAPSSSRGRRRYDRAYYQEHLPELVRRHPEMFG